MISKGNIICRFIGSHEILLIFFFTELFSICYKTYFQNALILGGPRLGGPRLRGPISFNDWRRGPLILYSAQGQVRR